MGHQRGGTNFTRRVAPARLVRSLGGLDRLRPKPGDPYRRAEPRRSRGGKAVMGRTARSECAEPHVTRDTDASPTSLRDALRRRRESLIAPLASARLSGLFDGPLAQLGERLVRNQEV